MTRIGEMSMADAEQAGRERARAYAAGDDGYVASTDAGETFAEYLDRARREEEDAMADKAAIPDIGIRVREAVRRAMHGSARSEQSRDRRLGPSELGGCRSYLARVIAEVPFDESYSEDTKWAAFVGTAVGDMVEMELVADDPERTRSQVSLTATLPRLGVKISGHCDIVEPEGVSDVKTKDGLAMVRRVGPDFHHKVQANIYLLAAIQEGLVPADGTWSLVYLDRSGRDDEPFVVSGTLDMEIIEEAEKRLEDAFYAAEYDLDSAPRDKPYDYCVRYCPFFTSCRGADEHQVSGLITDKKYLDAITAYQEATAAIKEAEKVKDEAKAVLSGISGSTGDYELSWTSVPATEISTFVRPAYDRISLRKVPKPKTPRKRKVAFAEPGDVGLTPAELAGEDA